VSPFEFYCRGIVTDGSLIGTDEKGRNDDDDDTADGGHDFYDLYHAQALSTC
jgi:hypothetical protein